MKAFWGAFGGWAAAQAFLAMLVICFNTTTFADGLTFSLLVGGVGACLGACLTAGRDNVPTFGCLSYLALWGLLIWAGLKAVALLGLPGLLVAVTATTGVLTGFWLMGSGPLSPVFLLFLVLFSWVYGALSLFTPPAIFSLRNVFLTLALLALFQLTHLVLARVLRPRRQ